VPAAFLTGEATVHIRQDEEYGRPVNHLVQKNVEGESLVAGYALQVRVLTFRDVIGHSLNAFEKGQVFP
jgi:hypothetical protein